MLSSSQITSGLVTQVRVLTSVLGLSTRFVAHCCVTIVTTMIAVMLMVMTGLPGAARRAVPASQHQERRTACDRPVGEFGQREG